MFLFLFNKNVYVLIIKIKSIKIRILHTITAWDQFQGRKLTQPLRNYCIKILLLFIFFWFLIQTVTKDLTTYHTVYSCVCDKYNHGLFELYSDS